MEIYFLVQISTCVQNCFQAVLSRTLCQWINFLIFLEYGILPLKDINYFRVEEQVSHGDLK